MALFEKVQTINNNVGFRYNNDDDVVDGSNNSNNNDYVDDFEKKFSKIKLSLRGQ